MGCLYQKSIKNQSKIVPKSTPKRSQIGPNSVQNRSKIGFGTDFAANIDFGPLWSRFRTVLGPLLAASWRPLGCQVGVKLVQKSIFGGPGWRAKTNMMLGTFLNRFLVGFETILESKIDPKSVQTRCQERSRDIAAHLRFHRESVSYTHLTLPTNREV